MDSFIFTVIKKYNSPKVLEDLVKSGWLYGMDNHAEMKNKPRKRYEGL
jgi:hypothetical protein